MRERGAQIAVSEMRMTLKRTTWLGIAALSTATAASSRLESKEYLALLKKCFRD